MAKILSLTLYITTPGGDGSGAATAPGLASSAAWTDWDMLLWLTIGTPPTGDKYKKAVLF
jgi:hypothetical protein